MLQDHRQRHTSQNTVNAHSKAASTATHGIVFHPSGALDGGTGSGAPLAIAKRLTAASAWYMPMSRMTVSPRSLAVLRFWAPFTST